MRLSPTSLIVPPALRSKDVNASSLTTLAFRQIVTKASRNRLINWEHAVIYGQAHAICGGRSASIGWSGRRLDIEDNANSVEKPQRRDAEGAARAAREYLRRLVDGVLSTIEAA